MRTGNARTLEQVHARVSDWADVFLLFLILESHPFWRWSSRVLNPFKWPVPKIHEEGTIWRHSSTGLDLYLPWCLLQELTNKTRQKKSPDWPHVSSHSFWGAPGVSQHAKPETTETPTTTRLQPQQGWSCGQVRCQLPPPLRSLARNHPWTPSWGLHSFCCLKYVYICFLKAEQICICVCVTCLDGSNLIAPVHFLLMVLFCCFF